MKSISTQDRKHVKTMKWTYIHIYRSVLDPQNLDFGPFWTLKSMVLRSWGVKSSKVHFWTLRLGPSRYVKNMGLSKVGFRPKPTFGNKPIFDVNPICISRWGVFYTYGKGKIIENLYLIKM
jgi:hypothetical protein